MSDQRFKLANKVNQRLIFSATVGEFTHKKIRGGGKGPVLLLKDLDLVDSKGKVIESDLADHVWVNANKNVFSIGKEIMPNDELMFSAVVKTYGITRNDVINKRDNIINQAKSKNQSLFSDYREDYLDWKDDWQNVLAENQTAKKRFQAGEIDRQTLKQIESDNINAYKQAQPDGVAVKSKKTQNQRIAQRKKKSVKLVDYQLEDLQNVKFLKERRLHHGWTRLKTSENDFQKIKFTKYLAARSFAYRDGVPFDVFDNK